MEGGGAASQNSQPGQGRGGGSANNDPFGWNSYNNYGGSGSFGSQGTGSGPGETLTIEGIRFVTIPTPKLAASVIGGPRPPPMARRSYRLDSPTQSRA